jgi:hypothetical protein
MQSEYAARGQLLIDKRLRAASVKLCQTSFRS